MQASAGENRPIDFCRDPSISFFSLWMLHLFWVQPEYSLLIAPFPTHSIHENLITHAFH